MCDDCQCSSPQNNPKLQIFNRHKTVGCRRCGQPAYILIDRVHPECTSCFTESCNKKIRSTIGRSRLLRPDDCVIIACSGGPSSTALAYLAKHSLENQSRKHQVFRPSILYIDCNCSPIKPELVDRDSRIDQLNKFLLQTSNNFAGWTIYWTSVEQIMNCNQSKIPYKIFSPDSFLDDLDLLNDQLINMLDEHLNDLNPTERREYLDGKISNLLVMVSSAINSSRSEDDQFKFIFVGSSSTKLANDLMVNVILGKGHDSHHTVNVCDERTSIPIFRPLKDFSSKEIAYYLNTNRISFNPDTSFDTYADKRSSIQKATENFLAKLYTDYPATYNTILNTGVKLKQR